MTGTLEESSWQLFLHPRPPFASAYYLKEDLRQLWSQPSKEVASAFLDGWIERARAKGIRQLITMSNTLSLHREGLLAYYDVPISTGPLSASSPSTRPATNSSDEPRERKQMKSQICFMTPSPLTREEAIRRLQDAELEIRALGVERVALFGSVLRNEARVDSDVDPLIGFAPGAKSFDRFLALSELPEERLGRRVEVVTREGLSPFLGPRILAEAEDVLLAA